MRLSFRLRETINHSQQKYFSKVSDFNISSFIPVTLFLTWLFFSYFKFFENFSVLQKVILPRNNYTIFQRIHISYIYAEIIKKG